MPGADKLRIWNRRPLKVLWVGLLAYGPVALFLDLRFDWPLGDINGNIWEYIFYSAMGIGVLVFFLAIFYLFKSPQKAVLLFAICFLDYLIWYSPLRGELDLASFRSYIGSEADYAKKHCAPVNFVQDGRRFSLGFCNLVIASDGSADFELFYDTSGDVGRYEQLSRNDKAIFADTIRKYLGLA